MDFYTYYLSIGAVLLIINCSLILSTVQLVLLGYIQFSPELENWIVIDTIITDVGICMVCGTLLYYYMIERNDSTFGTRLLLYIILIFSVVKFVWVSIGTSLFVSLYDETNDAGRLSLYCILCNGYTLVLIQLLIIKRIL